MSDSVVISVPTGPTSVVNARSGEEVVVITAIRGEKGDSGGVPAAFTFTDASLSLAGVLSQPHGLARIPAAVRVVDPNGNTVVPDNEVTANISAIAVDLATLRPLLAGNWQLIIY